MTRSYVIHYGFGHLSRCVTSRDYDTLSLAKQDAKDFLKEGFEIVIIADTDGNEWDMHEIWKGKQP